MMNNVPLHRRYRRRAGLLTTAAGLACLGLGSGAAFAQTAEAPPVESPVPEQGDAISSSDSGLENESGSDIIVTAQKRDERLQDVPITISAVGADALAEANVTQLFDLPRLVPTLRLGDSPGTVGARLNIRGIGSFGNSALEPSVAVFLDGVYVPRPSSVVGNFFDVEGVEVLSGPQGTLFGRNASAGALTLRSATPEFETSGSVRFEASTGANYRAEGVFNTALSDEVAVRIAAVGDLRGGYWHNDLTGERAGGLDTFAGRLSFNIRPNDRMRWVVRGDYTKVTGMPWRNWELIPSTVPASSRARYIVIQQGIAPRSDRFSGHNSIYTEEMQVNDHHWGVASDLSYDLTPGLMIRLVQGYRDWKADERDGDTLSLAVPVYGRDVDWRSQSHSHDLQLISERGLLLDGRLDFVAGLYYFNERLMSDYQNNFLANFCPLIVGRVAAPLLASCIAGPQRAATDVHFVQYTNSYAAYGQATFQIVPDRLQFTLGGRVTRDDKSTDYVSVVNNPAGVLLASNETSHLEIQDDRFTWRANLMYLPTEDLRFYATYATGFKSGGFNNGASARPLGLLRIFDPETVTNYELGMKSQWLDRALTLNLTLYRMDVDGFQERAQDSSGISVIRNVGSFRHQGAEMEMVANPSDWLRFNFALAYLDSKFLSYPNAPRPPYIGGVQDLTGARLTYAPEFTGAVGAQVRGNIGSGGVGWSFRTDLSFVSDQNIGASIDNNPLTIQDGYVLLGARLNITGPDERWSAGIFADNLTNQGYCQDMAYQVLEGPLGVRYAGGTPVRCIVGTPRRLGATVGLRF
jgi:iron complex outermembrane receptor protein